ncbi:MAG: DUF4388 domain-containing protein [Acidobacteriota bacterium]
MTTEGHFRGWNLSTILQMVEMDKRTCTLRVRCGENLGLLFFRAGDLIDAESGPLQGIDAAYEIVNWDGDTSVEVEGFCGSEQKSIDLPVTHLLLEGLARRDEERRESETGETSKPNGQASLTPQDAAMAAPAASQNAVAPQHAVASQNAFEALRDEVDSLDAEKEEEVSNLQSVLDRFRDEVPEFVATDLVNIDSGLSIGGATLDADFDSSVASACYAEVVKSNRRALDLLGLGSDSTEDILISTEKVFLLLRLLGSEYYHVVAITRKGNLGFARAIMKKFEPALLQAVNQLA